MITAIHPASADRAEAKRYGLCWHPVGAKWPCQPSLKAPEQPRQPTGSIECPEGHQHELPLTSSACWERARERRAPARRVAVTMREHEVATELMETGGTNQQIAKRLFLSEDTVKCHVKKLLGRVGVASRTELMAEVHNERVMLFPVPIAATMNRTEA